MNNQATVQPILARLNGIRAGIRALYAMHGTALLAAVLCGFLTATFVMDWSLHLPSEVRKVFLAAGVCLLIWTAYRRLLRPLSRPIADDDLAILVERRHRHLADRLISAIQLSRPSDDRYAAFNSPELVEQLVKDAADAAEILDLRDVLVRRYVLRAVTLGGFLVLLLAGAALAQPTLASIYLRRLVGLEVPWPKRTRLTVEGFVDGKKTIPRGDALRVEVKIEGVVPERGTIRTLYVEEGGQPIAEPMQLVRHQDGFYRFIHDFPRVNGPMRFRVKAGDDETDEQSVLTDTPPTVMTIQAFFEYPAYTRLINTPAHSPQEGGNLDAPLFTRVRLLAQANVPLSQASVDWIGPSGPPRPVPALLAPGARQIEFALEITEERAKYELKLRAANGLANRDPLVYDVRGRRDQKPEIRLTSPPAAAQEEYITPVCDYPIRAAITDDYGLRRDAEGRPDVRLLYRLSGGPEDAWQTVPLRYPEATLKEARPRAGEQIDLEYVLHVEPLGLKSGDWILFRLAATDNKEVGGANETMTRPFRFSITSVEELEKELERAVDRIKQELTKQSVAAQRNRARARRHQDEIAGETPTYAQRSEVLMSQRNQVGITRELLKQRDLVRQVRDRGAYNKIFNEEAIHRLEMAGAELDRLAGDDPTRPAVSRLASEALNRGADAPSRDGRTTALEIAVQQIDETISGITTALTYLERWATYQEVVRMMRFILAQQEELRLWLQKRLGGGDEEPEPPKKKETPSQPKEKSP
jgi:hypothetical protein